jgi:prepilin peptidase CpaA
LLNLLPVLGIAALLLLAAWRDLATRMIPDGIPVGLVILGLMLRLPEGWGAVLASVLVAVLVFVVLLVLAMRGFLGGGDVKLAAAVACGLPPAATWDFIFATTVVGGLLGLGYMARPRLVLPGRVLAIEAWRLRRGGPVPYAVAIAAGAILVLLRDRVA